MNCSKIYYPAIFFSILFFITLQSTGKESLKSPGQSNIYPLERYINIGENEGLNSKIIYHTIQDRDGFIWLGTNAGVFRYDGKMFKRFTVDDGIMDNEVFSIFQDSKDRIWFLTFNGRLSFWKNGKIYNPSNTPFLNRAYLKESLFSSFEDSNGRIWFGSLNGFIVIKDDSLEIIKSVSFLNKVRSVYVHEDSTGNIWSFNMNKMFKILDNNSRDSITLPENVGFRKVCHGTNNVMFFYNPKGVYKISNQSTSLEISPKDMPSQEKILNIFSSGDYIWLCTVGNGCYEYKNNKLVKIYFSKKTITSALRDRENNLWLGTLGNTLIMLPSPNESVTNFTQSTGLSSDVVTSIASSKNDSLWLGYGNGMVDIISKGKKSTFNLITSNDSNYYRISDIIFDSATTWLGTDLGIYYFEKGKLNQISYRNYKNIPENYSVKRIIKDSNGNIYATYSFNLLKVEKDHIGLNIHTVLDSIRRTFSLVEINKGEFVISSLSGLIKYIPGEKESAYKTDVDFSSKRIIDLKLDSDSNLLMASDGFGLFILKNGKLMQHFSLANGLTDNICNRIAVSGNFIYVATNNGLNILKKENGKYVLTEKITTLNGLLSNSVNDIALNKHLIYIATDNGFTVINKDVFSTRSFIGKIEITEIITDTIQDLSDSVFCFKSDIPRLLIRFAYPVFNPANQLNIKYRLVKNETDNSDWFLSENNKIEFSSLEPGKYFLQLKPDANGKTSTITSFNFVIVPLWWQTLMAKVAFSLIILVLIVYLLRLRLKKKFEREVNLLKEQSLLESERNRIASDMHDDIGADLTKISIWSAILGKSTTDTKDVVKKISQSSDEVLQKMDQIIWALSSVRNSSIDLISYLRMFSTRYLEDTGIKLEFEAEKSIPDLKVSYIQRRNIFLVVKELLHNSVKHSRARTISIKILYEEPQLVINYTDDGGGFDMNNKSGGFGILNIQNRMHEINSIFNFYSKEGNGFSADISVTLNKIN